jgi:hypothetical protein
MCVNCTTREYFIYENECYKTCPENYFPDENKICKLINLNLSQIEEMSSNISNNTDICNPSTCNKNGDCIIDKNKPKCICEKNYAEYFCKFTIDEINKTIYNSIELIKHI